MVKSDDAVQGAKEPGSRDLGAPYHHPLASARPAPSQEALRWTERIEDPVLVRELDAAHAFLIDPEDQQTYSTEGIEALGLLTPAETSVCSMLVGGRGTREIAEQRDVSLETVRSQIKDVLQKLACSDRLDLPRMALSTHPPVQGARERTSPPC